jgi:hypothetical protein
MHNDCISWYQTDFFKQNPCTTTNHNSPWLNVNRPMPTKHIKPMKQTTYIHIKHKAPREIKNGKGKAGPGQGSGSAWSLDIWGTRKAPLTTSSCDDPMVSILWHHWLHWLIRSMHNTYHDSQTVFLKQKPFTIKSTNSPWPHVNKPMPAKHTKLLKPTIYIHITHRVLREIRNGVRVSPLLQVS